MNSLNDDTQILDTLRQFGRTTQNQFREILDTVAAIGSGLSLTTAPAFEDDVQVASASRDVVRRSIEVIDSAPPATEQLRIERGILVGLVLRTRRFELVDAATTALYRGTISEDASMQADGLIVGESGFVKATIREDREFSTEKVTCKLVHIERA